MTTRLSTQQAIAKVKAALQDLETQTTPVIAALIHPTLLSESKREASPLQG